MSDPKDIREWNYQQMTGEDSMSPDNPSGHPMIVPQSTPTRQPVELPVERLALVSRVEFDAVERELAEARRDAVEAIDARNVAIAEKAFAEAEASERLAEAHEKIRKLAEALGGAHEIQQKLIEQRDRLTEAIRLVIEDSELPNGHFWPDVVEKCRNALAAVKGGKP